MKESVRLTDEMSEAVSAAAAARALSRASYMNLAILRQLKRDRPDLTQVIDFLLARFKRDGRRAAK